jgi:hypothetical protein
MALTYDYPSFNISKDRVINNGDGSQLFNELQSFVERIRDFHRETVARIAYGESLVIKVTSTSSASVTAGTSPIIICDASSAAITVNLPAASISNGYVYYVKKVDATANTVTIDGSGSETIDGGTTAVISSQYECLTIVCDGTSWYIV